MSKLVMYPSHDRKDAIDELSDLAGNATGQPPLPPGGIPKQWLPGWIRWPLRVVLLPFVWMELFAQWVARKIVPPPFKQEGKCLKRGNCCYYLLVPEPKGVLTQLFYFWFTQVQGFYLRKPDAIDCDGEKMMVMGCRYLQKNGQCSHYRLRPLLCRQWPLIEYFGPPRILKGCGYQAKPRKPQKSNAD